MQADSLPSELPGEPLKGIRQAAVLSEFPSSLHGGFTTVRVDMRIGWGGCIFALAATTALLKNWDIGVNEKKSLALTSVIV